MTGRRMSSIIRRDSVSPDISGMKAVDVGMLTTCHQLFRSGYSLEYLQGLLGACFQRLKIASECALTTSVKLGDVLSLHRVLPLARALVHGHRE